MTRLIAIGAIVAAAVAAATAQGPGRTNSDWPTAGADAQRTSWMRNEAKLSAAAIANAVGKPAVQLLWKTKLDIQAGRPAALGQPLLLQNIISHMGFKALAFVATSAEVVYAIDYDLNRVYWRQALSTASRGARTAACGRAVPAITRAARVIPLGMPGARGGAGAPARGPAGPPPANRGGINTNNLPINSAVYAVSSGGMLHFLNPHIGQDIQPAIKFLQPGANVAGLIQLDNVLYAATADNCGGSSPGVSAIDLGSDAKTITRWESTGGNVVGTTGPAFGLDGTLFVAAAKTVSALERKSLKQRDQFAAPTAFATSPIVFQIKERDVVAVANTDGTLYLLDAKSLAGAPLARSPAYGPLPETPHALATWEEPDGGRWILAPSRTALVAFKVTQSGSAFALEKAWTREMASPVAPTILYDVVFALGGGRSTVLYALDARGKELWNSGTAITASSTIAPAAGDSQIYVSANDGTLYAFGLPMER